MAKPMHSCKRKAEEAIASKARARCLAYVMRPEYLAEIARFRLMDDDFMSKCLENAPECIELILQIILGKKDLKVVKSQTEYPIKSLQGRGVRFDVFAKDSKGREYDIEIQRADVGADVKRARYNSALMDANALKPGEDVGKLRDTYVIFITETDVMGGDQDVYVYDRTEKKSGRSLDDGTHIIYVNGATRSMSDILEGWLMTCSVATRRRCILTFSRDKLNNLRTQKKGGSQCARQWKELRLRARRAASVRPCSRRRSGC